MKQPQRWAAADVLTGARQRDGVRAPLPRDDLVDQFGAGITNSCVIATMSITDAAAGLYPTEHDRYSDFQR